jgi:hypothetical protein
VSQKHGQAELQASCSVSLLASLLVSLASRFTPFRGFFQK